MNWNMVRDPQEKGGLGIKDPQFMNKALGATRICRLVTGKAEWWKTVLINKDFQSKHWKCLEQVNIEPKGSVI
jgi:hypothetical protein